MFSEYNVLLLRSNLVSLLQLTQHYPRPNYNGPLRPCLSFRLFIIYKRAKRPNWMTGKRVCFVFHIEQTASIRRTLVYIILCPDSCLVCVFKTGRTFPAFIGSVARFLFGSGRPWRAKTSNPGHAYSPKISVLVSAWETFEKHITRPILKTSVRDRCRFLALWRISGGASLHKTYYLHKHGRFIFLDSSKDFVFAVPNARRLFLI